MSYYHARTFDRPFEATLAATRDALAQAGFGVISEIDVQKTMKAKLDADMRPYLILGACNPRLAYEALQLENKVGVMLPCNVVVQDLGGGRTEVAAIDPVASMQAIANPALMEKAGIVRDMLAAAIDRI